MSRFVFRLQRVLDIRIQAVDEAQTYLENCRKVVSELRRMLLEERDLYLSERDTLNEAIRSGETFKYPMFEQSLEKRKSRMMELLEAIRVAESDVDIAEQHLLVCRRNLKVLENLRDKKQAEHVDLQERKERKFLDEQATLRHALSVYDSSRE
ncbi:MAG: flagellar export protein FliJ [Betaproteobacteria bacterium]|nr:flagellar export protein FliJ [Betaproteobacteria bacterium]